MIGHQDIGMNSATLLLRTFVEPAQVGSVIVVTEERGLTAVAALDDVRGNAREIEAGFAGHSS